MNNKAIQIVILILLTVMVGLAFYNREHLPALSLVAITAFTLALFIPVMMAQFGRGRTLSIDALQQELENNKELLLVDLRSESDYQGEPGHIDGAINIPLERLQDQLSALDSHLDKPVALICSGERHSKKAAHLLKRKGFSLVYVVKGGMQKWINRGFPLALNR